jgi:hypothetical protein
MIIFSLKYHKLILVLNKGIYISKVKNFLLKVKLLEFYYLTLTHPLFPKVFNTPSFILSLLILLILSLSSCFTKTIIKSPTKLS